MLHTVDNGKFGIALFGLFEQALGLVEEPGALQCHSHAIDDRGQETDFKFTEGMFTVIDSQWRHCQCHDR